MSSIYNVFNTSSENEFSNFLNKLDLNVNELLNLEYIAENNNMSLDNKRKKLLELMAGSSTNNYNLCVEQFNKNKKERVLKENDNLMQQLNLNQIMELNELVVNVSKKLKVPNCMQGIFNIIKTKSNANVANAFLGMVQQSSVNDSNLKFNTDLQVNGQNLAQIIYNLKNDIEMFINSVECPKEEQTEKKEVTENVNEEVSIENRIAGIYNIKNGSFKILNNGQNHNLSIENYKNGLVRYGIQKNSSQEMVCYITAWNEEYAWNARRQIMKKYNDVNIDKWHLEYYVVNNQSFNGKKIIANYDSAGNPINEAVHKTIPIEQTISSIKTWVESVTKPESLKTLIQMIDEYMAVAKNNIQINTLAHLKSIAQTKLNKLEKVNPKIEECLAQQVVSDVCGEDTFNGLLNSLKPTTISITVNKETGECEEACPECQPMFSVPNMDLVNGVQSVQPLTLSPTAIDAPILKKPDQASVVAAISALSSHLTDVKSDSRENNLECLQAINTLLSQISTYFNDLLSESVDNANLINYERFIGQTVTDGNNDSYTIVHVYEDYSYHVWFGLYDKKEKTFISASISDMKNYFNFDVDNYINSDEDYWDGEDEDELNEDTIYDHSWYEVKGQKYPKRTKNGIEGLPIKKSKQLKEGKYIINSVKEKKITTSKAYAVEAENENEALELWRANKIKPTYIDPKPYTTSNESLLKCSEVSDEQYNNALENADYYQQFLDETCSAGATCSANVSGFAKPLGSKPKKRKKPSVDVEMFKESVINDIPCAFMIENGKNTNNIRYKIVDGKGYLYINEGLVKANTKQSILEAIDDIYNDCLDLPVLENFTPYQLEILMEEDLNNNTIITPQEKQNKEQELDNEIKSNPQLKVGLTDDKSSQIIDNQELVGIDDSDLQDKKYIVKDPTSGKIKVANSSQIKIMKNNNGVQ